LLDVFFISENLLIKNVLCYIFVLCVISVPGRIGAFGTNGISGIRFSFLMIPHITTSIFDAACSMANDELRDRLSPAAEKGFPRFLKVYF